MQDSAKHPVVLGARSYEPEEIAFLQRTGVRIIDSVELQQRGFADCLHEALAIVSAAPAGFGVTLDLDAIDPLLAPGVGSPEPEGLSARDVLEAVSGIAYLSGFKALEIVEYNPGRDRLGITASLISDLVGRVLPPERD